MAGYIVLIMLCFPVVTVLCTDDSVVFKMDPVRYGFVPDDDGGNPQLVDMWVKMSDLQKAARYTPETENVYHLFTRCNPSVSTSIMYMDVRRLAESDFSADRRTVFIIHGWMNNATSDINTVLVPAFLRAEDVNVFVVDWSAGADNKYIVALLNTVTSGQSVAMFLNWLCAVTGVTPASFHIVGHSLGGQQAGIVGRNLYSKAGYITALDPALPGWLFNKNVFKSGDGTYTEVIHTNAGMLGYPSHMGQVDFYPNGGTLMPGCMSASCDHRRSFDYFGESVESGGFTAIECNSYASAFFGKCDGPASLLMGGIKPKNGMSGIFYLRTRAEPPYSIDGFMSI